MSTLTDGTPLMSNSSFNDAEKIQNFFSIGDSCHFAAQYLEEELLTALDPTSGTGNNLSKTKQASLCANLNIIIKSLTMAYDLAYTSSSRLCHTSQEKRAHPICAREATRQHQHTRERPLRNDLQRDCLLCCRFPLVRMDFKTAISKGRRRKPDDCVEIPHLVQVPECTNLKNEKSRLQLTFDGHVISVGAGERRAYPDFCQAIRRSHKKTQFS